MEEGGKEGGRREGVGVREGGNNKILLNLFVFVVDNYHALTTEVKHYDCSLNILDKSRK